MKKMMKWKILLGQGDGDVVGPLDGADGADVDAVGGGVGVGHLVLDDESCRCRCC
jgi:hypothetical protein